MARKREHLGMEEPELSGDSKLCRKWCTSLIDVANSLDRTHKDILEITTRKNVLDNCQKSTQVYFAQKAEFENQYNKGKVKCLWNYYQAKDERMKLWRNLEGKEYDTYMNKIYNGEKQYF